MKIGILTFHRAINYGAVLQCYSLQEVLRQRGHQVEIIDYRISAIENQKKLISLQILKSRKGVISKIRYLLKNLFIYVEMRKAIKTFETFLSTRLFLSSKVEDAKDLSTYDCIIFGSDQIWNPSLCGGFDPLFWGQFPKGNTLFVSYAASLGETKDLNDAQWNQVGERILVFDRISVRENSLKLAIENKFSIPVNCCLDPTLLINPDCLDNIAFGQLTQIMFSFIMYRKILVHVHLQSDCQS